MGDSGASTSKLVSLSDAVATHVHSGQRVMVGGFGRGGSPFTLLETLADRPGQYRELTIIKNDASEPHLGVGPLIRQGMVEGLISTHIGLNPDAIERMNRGEIEVTLIPQGIFAEKIRAAGAGIPAFLTDIGLHTPVGEAKETIVVDGAPLLLERALWGDVALLCADRADPLGNCWWRGSNRNMSPLMGMACPVVLVEAKEIVPLGAIEPENVHLPGIFVTCVVQAERRRHAAAGETAG